MTQLTRLAGLAALTGLAACGSSGGGAVSDLVAASSVYTPSYYDEVDGVDNIEVITSNNPDDGLVGFMGFADGKVLPIKVRLSDDEATAFLSINGGPELEFDSRIGSLRWTGEPGELFMVLASFHENIAEFDPLEGPPGGGYFGQQADPDNLPDVPVDYSGGGKARGAVSNISFDMFMTVDFSNNTIDGFLDNAYINEDSIPISFTGTLTGEVAGSFLAMESVVTGEGVSGNLDYIGAFYDLSGSFAAGGVAGTINGETFGGDFSLGPD